MTGDIQVAAAAAGGCHIFSGCGFPSPGLEDFDFRPIFSIGAFHFTKPMLIALLCAAIVVVFFWAAFWKPKIVPRGVQNVGEVALFGVRDQILRPSLGKRGDGFLPFLTAMFFFIYFMNLMEIIPFFQFPATSRIGFPWSLVAIVYLTYLYLGFKNQGVPVTSRKWSPATSPSGCSSSWCRSSSPATSSSSRSLWVCGCSPTCSPATCCC